MAITRVQANSTVSGFVGSVAVSFASPPTVGNSVIVLVTGTTTISTLTDNQSNSYTFVKTQLNSGSGWTLDVYFCPAITGTGTPFTVTAAGGSALRGMTIIEVGTGLTLDQTASNQGTGPSAVSGTTAALTGSTVFVAAIIQTSSSFITVDATTPTWTQEFESIGTMETDSRIVPSAAGTTQSAAWALNGAQGYAGIIAAFKETGGGGGGRNSLFIWS